MLKRRVNDYFTENNIHQAGNTKLLFKSLILISTAVASYVTLIFFTPAVWLSLPLCVFLGLNLALIGFNVMHDGGHHSFSKHRHLNTVQHLVFWFTKAAYVVLYIILPILFVGWLPWLIGFIIITFVCGVSISVVFQMAHVVGGTKFSGVNEGREKPDWAIHQVCTTADFATENRFLHWLLGGLNSQIEHHLFPRISHIHYPAVSAYVKETCKEYGIVYNEYRSMLAAFVSHLVHLYRLGRSASPGN